MARDKAKDDMFFNCSQEHEFNYVSNLYKEQKEVYDFLKENCKSDNISRYTHKKVYEMIKANLNYSVPN